MCEHGFEWYDAKVFVLWRVDEKGRTCEKSCFLRRRKGEEEEDGGLRCDLGWLEVGGAEGEMREGERVGERLERRVRCNIFGDARIVAAYQSEILVLWRLISFKKE